MRANAWRLLALLALSAALMAGWAPAHTDSTPILANVVVPCAFAVNLTPQSAYPRIGNITINHTTQALSSACTLGIVPGTFSLYYGQGTTPTLTMHPSATAV